MHVAQILSSSIGLSALALCPNMEKCQFFTDILMNNAYMDYLEFRFSEIMQYKLEKRIHFELIWNKHK